MYTTDKHRLSEQCQATVDDTYNRSLVYGRHSVLMCHYYIAFVESRELGSRVKLEYDRKQHARVCFTPAPCENFFGSPILSRENRPKTSHSCSLRD